MKDQKVKRLVIAAMFAALTCVATMSIRIPTPATNGYVNVGDTVVLLSAWLLGGAWGALAAGIGSGLADLLSGYAYYVPGTFVIKALMALAAFALFHLLARRVHKAFAYVISAAAAEAVMVLGYFLYASLILGRGWAAAASVIGNIGQGVTCGVLSLALVTALNLAKVPSLIAVK